LLGGARAEETMRAVLGAAAAPQQPPNSRRTTRLVRSAVPAAPPVPSPRPGIASRRTTQAGLGLWPRKRGAGGQRQKQRRLAGSCGASRLSTGGLPLAALPACPPAPSLRFPGLLCPPCCRQGYISDQSGTSSCLIGLFAWKLSRQERSQLKLTVHTLVGSVDVLFLFCNHGTKKNSSAKRNHDTNAIMTLKKTLQHKEVREQRGAEAPSPWRTRRRRRSRGPGEGRRRRGRPPGGGAGATTGHRRVPGGAARPRSHTRTTQPFFFCAG
jgi:hypothetical protein